jgi:hypothetical protein
MNGVVYGGRLPEKQTGSVDVRWNEGGGEQN